MDGEEPVRRLYPRLREPKGEPESELEEGDCELGSKGEKRGRR